MFEQMLLAGCVNSCNRHGSCVLEEGEYHCQCNDGWAGIDCSVRLEMECNDELDNDQGKRHAFLTTLIFYNAVCFHIQGFVLMLYDYSWTTNIVLNMALNSLFNLILSKRYFNFANFK